MPPFALKARVVFPVDQPPIENGYITVDGERILAVGKTTDASDIRDLGDVAILPGLVNAHTHLEFSNLKQPLGRKNTPLPTWIRKVLQQRGGRPAKLSKSLALGIAESLAAGVTTVGEIATAARSEYPQQADLNLTLFGEVIGFSTPRSVSAFAGFQEWLGPELGSETDAARLAISPHAPYTVHPDLLDRLVQLSAQRCLPLAMHLAESPEELQLLSDNSGPFRELLDERGMWDASSIPRGTTPLDYLKRLARSHRSLVIHGNYLDPNRELSFLAKNQDKMSLVYCPRTHAYFGHEPYPLAAALEQGVRVALGTDSRASNPDLNLLSEVAAVIEFHPTVRPSDALHMATLAGAEALSLAHSTGSLTPSKLADLAVIALPPNTKLADSEQLLHDLANPSSQEPKMIATWRTGRCVWSAREASDEKR